MKKCGRYLDYMELSGDVTCSQWQDELLHARRCPDCAHDMKIRTELLNICSKLEEPEYPLELHGYIMAGIKAGSNGANEVPSLIDSLFDKFLRPVEFSMSLATIVVIAFLLTLEFQPAEINQPRRSYVTTTSEQAEPKQNLVAISELDEVSGKDVQNFLQRLAEYRQHHPEIDHPGPRTSYRPPVRLVSDGQ